MRTSAAALGSAAFFVVAPGTFVGLGPWLITHWEIPGSSPPLRVVLVVTGFNRFVRNPMYVGLLLAILGQALLFDSIWLVVYAVLGWVVTASFVRWYEEPTLISTYGEQYEETRLEGWRVRVVLCLDVLCALGVDARNTLGGPAACTHWHHQPA